jgi:uncharacterized Zn-binding protein involved in type VI secretion
MISVGVNPPKTPVTEGSVDMSPATLPNVCKMPGPPAPFIPTPLPNLGRSADRLESATSTVKIEGKKVAIKGSYYMSQPSPDVASQGTGGGIVSSKTQGKTEFVAPGSMNVKAEGKNIQLLGDAMTNNGGSPANAATMPGNQQPPQTPAVSEDDCIVGTYDDIKDRCPDGHQAHHIVPDYTARMGNRAQGMAGVARIPDMPSFGGGPSICLEGQARVSGSAHNVAHRCDAVIAALGRQTDNGPPGTAPASQVLEASVEAAVEAAEHCEQQIRDEVDRAYADVDPNQSMRTTQQPSSGEARPHLANGNSGSGNLGTF